MFKKYSVLISILLVLSLLLNGCSLISKATENIPNPADLLPGGGQSGQSLQPGSSGNSSSGSGPSQAIVPAPPRGVTGTVSTGPVVAAANVPVPSSGGTISVTDTASPIAGLAITIPANAYPDTRQFKLSYAPIQSHTFGESFNPVTPMISIDNGGAYADEMIEVKIPVKVPDGYFAMGFYYNDKTKKLEGIPTVAQDAGSITVGTRHFTDFLFSMIPNIKLKPDIDTGFRPGIDDWQFVNGGSYIAPGGHCAGQSVSAMWYYLEQPDGKDLTLYGRYDNNGNKPATPGLDYDDSLGYRFASVIQGDLNFDSWAADFMREQRGLNDELAWKAFAYSMQLTGEPQYVGLSAAVGGHAMICYRIFKGNLYIADPNYPGNTERRIEYANNTLTPYESGLNADEIKKGNSVKFTRIGYTAKSAMIDWNKIGQRWAEFKNKTIGDDKFPAYRVIYKDEKNTFKELTNGTVVSDKKIVIGVDFSGTIAGVNVFKEGVELPWDGDAKFELKPGNNQLGIWIRKQVNNNDKYVDFKYINITYNSEVTPSTLGIDPETLDGQENQSYTFTLKNPGKVSYTRLDWLKDGIVSEPAGGPTFKALFSAGQHTVSVNLYDLSNKLLGTAKATVNISGAKVDNLAKLQQLKTLFASLSGKGIYKEGAPGAEANKNGTFTIGTGTMYSGTFNNSVEYRAMPITWSGASFTGKISYTEPGAPSTDEVSGTVSADGNTVLSLTYTHKDTNYMGYGPSATSFSVYTEKLQLQNVPLTGYTGGDFGRANIAGADVKSYLVAAEYQHTSYKNSKVDYTTTYVSPDWTATSMFERPGLLVSFK